MNNTRRALIIQPGAVGDVILTLPLAQFILAERAIDQVDMLGHLERLSYLQPRTLLGEMFSLESVALHQLFESSDDFELNDSDDLVELFRPYELIVSFLSDLPGHFEKNLAGTTNRTCPCDVTTLQLRPQPDSAIHVSAFFIHQFIFQMPDMDLDTRRSYLDGPQIKITDTCKQKGKGLLKQHGVDLNKPVVLLHPGSGGEQKCWPIQNLLQLAEKIDQAGQTPVFLLGPAEEERSPDMLGLLSKDYAVLSHCDLDQIAALLSCAAAYVGNDSGITHLAAAILPTIAIFGATNPNHWRPLGSCVRICHAENAGQDWPTVEQVWDCFNHADPFYIRKRNFLSVQGE